MTQSIEQAHPAAVVLSGGLASTTVLATARREGFEADALGFRCGQRPVQALVAAEFAAKFLGAARPVVAGIDLRAFGGSALTADIEVPEGRSATDMSQGVPVTCVPARNTVFLSVALAWAATPGASDTLIGVNALDDSGDPDGRPCGACDACLLRAKGFAEVGTADPLRVRFGMG